jgi:hypothetical protein
VRELRYLGATALLVMSMAVVTLRAQSAPPARSAWQRGSMTATSLSSPATQSANCNVTPLPVVAPPVDLCQKALDFFTFVAPQVGVALSGGNPMLGEGGTLGGWGKRSASLRMTAVDGQLPHNDVTLTTGATAVASDFGARRTPFPVPSFTAGIGLIRGMPVGLSNVGGVDLLLGASFVPSVHHEPIALKTAHDGLALAYGVRVGALQESALVPGLSVTYIRRRLPTTDFLFTPNNDTLNVEGASVTSQSWRVTASKRFVFFGVAAGVGRDIIDARSGFSAVVNETVAGQAQRVAVTIPVAVDKVSRTSAFLNASVGLPQLQLVGELGYSRKGDIRETVNRFGEHTANEGYRYGSLGIGFRF